MSQKIVLPEKLVGEIINIYINEPIGMKAIGEKFGVSREVISRILKENNIQLDTPGQKFKGGKSESDKRYREKRKESGISDDKYKEWLSKNKDHVKQKQKEWREKNRGHIREYSRINQLKRIKNNSQYRLSQRFRTAIWQNIKDNGATKYNNTFNLLSYTFDELKTHLEGLFEPGMTWDNYGKWHVDHAIPQSKFTYDTTDSEEFKQCWSLTNLKPMWGDINCSKKAALTNLSLDSVRYLKEHINVNEIGYKDVILSKDYLKAIINTYGKEYLAEYVDDILVFIKTVSPELPEITTDENISQIGKYINNVSPLNEDGNIVNARINSYGNMLLKKHFKSYWKSSYKNTKTPTEVWLNDKKMRYILSYRLGLNNSDEVFDITLHQMIKGLSANRYTISFFKPLLAAYLYKRYLGNNETPIVFDPCAGFGGRLLGFKTAYPKGTYIACEPNIDTYNELISLGKQFDNVHIFNQTFESFDTNFEYDLLLTSIPYFDLEKYSANIEYCNYQDWFETFLAPMIQLPNCVINMSYQIAKDFDLLKFNDLYLVNNDNHLNRKKNYEPIIKLNFKS